MEKDDFASRLVYLWHLSAVANRAMLTKKKLDLLFHFEWFLYFELYFCVQIELHSSTYGRGL